MNTGSVMDSPLGVAIFVALVLTALVFAVLAWVMRGPQP